MGDGDEVNHPQHYTRNPSGVECIEVTKHMSFCRGNVIKYVWRAGLKANSDELKDLRKAAWYLEQEIAKVEAVRGEEPTYLRAKGKGLGCDLPFAVGDHVHVKYVGAGRVTGVGSHHVTVILDSGEVYRSLDPIQNVVKVDQEIPF